jgi:hypothetical protein
MLRSESSGTATRPPPRPGRRSVMLCAMAGALWRNRRGLRVSLLAAAQWLTVTVGVPVTLRYGLRRHAEAGPRTPGTSGLVECVLARTARLGELGADYMPKEVTDRATRSAPGPAALGKDGPAGSRPKHAAPWPWCCGLPVCCPIPLDGVGPLPSRTLPWMFHGGWIWLAHCVAFVPRARRRGVRRVDLHEPVSQRWWLGSRGGSRAVSVSR